MHQEEDNKYVCARACARVRAPLTIA